MSCRRPLLLPLLALLAGLGPVPLRAADAPAPAEFAWRGTLALPAGAPVARVTLPADAMLRLQSADARDVRVFNAEGVPVAFALAAPAAGAPTAPPAQTRAYTAYPLFTAASGQRPAQGAVAVHLDSTGSQSSVWVRFTDKDSSGAAGTAEATATRLPSVLLDTRGDPHTITALTLQATLPANTLVHLTLASSADLAQWTPVPVQGPVFRFEGAGAPAQQTLQLAQPLRLQGRYLRLGWDAQTGVQVQGVTGIVAQTLAAPGRIRAPLSAGMADGSSAMDWPLSFATPLAALRLSTTQDNTLVPVRILGRNDATQPWRPLAQGVLFRLGSDSPGAVNPPIPLGGASVRHLRVEALQGMPLPSPNLQATAEFDPVQLAFLASGTGPFELAVGRAHTPAAAVDPGLLSTVVQGKLQDLPQAEITQVRVGPSAAGDSALQRLLPAGTEPRNVLLWAVLLAGVLVLAGVAYALLRQLSAK